MICDGDEKISSVERKAGDWSFLSVQIPYPGQLQVFRPYCIPVTASLPFSLPKTPDLAGSILSYVIGRLPQDSIHDPAH